MESLPETERENVAGAAELPTVTGERVTEPPAGTAVGGSCAVEAGAPDGPITSPEPPAAMERIAAATSTSPVLVSTTESGIFWPFEARGCEGEAVLARAAGLHAAPEDAAAGRSRPNPGRPTPPGRPREGKGRYRGRSALPRRRGSRRGPRPRLP